MVWRDTIARRSGCSIGVPGLLTTTSMHQNAHAPLLQSASWPTALGVAPLVWLAIAGGLVMLGAAPGELFLAHVFVPFLAAFVYQSSAVALSPASRLLRAAGLWGVWVLASAGAVGVLPRFGLAWPWSSWDLLWQQFGFAGGLAAGWLHAPEVARALNRMRGPWEVAAKWLFAAAALAAVLLPIPSETLLAQVVDAWRIPFSEAYLRLVPQQVYALLKPFILWVPLGLLYALAQRGASLGSWAVAGALSFPVIGLPLFWGTLRMVDLLEILGAFWGVWAGLWLGARIHTAHAPRPENEPRPPARTGPEPAEVTVQSIAGSLVRRAGAAVLLGGAGIWAWFFPRWEVSLLCGLAIYAVLLWRYRHAWLLVVPAALPLLNLAPSTGRFFLDEFDLLLAVTSAMALWHGQVAGPQISLSRPVATALGVFGLFWSVSLVIGLLPFSPLDANAFSTYWSHYNSLRVGKGLFWGAVLLALLRFTVPATPGLVMRWLVPGMWLGLAGVIAVGLWERWLFADLFDLSAAYRITATFSSMHTGGSHIEAYLAVAIPFAWFALERKRGAATKAAGLILLTLGAYLTVLTAARGGVLALGVVTTVMLLGSWRARRGRGEGAGPVMLAGAGLALVGAVMFLGVSGGYLQQRFAQSERDWATRLGHWQEALAMRDRGWRAALFGMGLGRFPEAWLYRSSHPVRPGTYQFTDENGDRYLRLSAGEVLYLAQRVEVRPGHDYTLSLRLRSGGANARLEVPLCEKHLLDSRRCQWTAIPLTADGRWHAHVVKVKSGTLGEGDWLSRRPIAFSLYNGRAGTLVDVDDVQLRDEAGHDLIRNGDFAAGGDDWFFSTHSHLPWHIKNLWVGILFELGWLGLLSFMLLAGVTIVGLGRRLWQGSYRASVLLAALSGFLTVGIFDSLLDAPRLATLFFLLTLFAGMSASPAERTVSGAQTGP